MILEMFPALKKHMNHYGGNLSEILSILKKIKLELGTMVILVEQNVKAALKVADRPYVMDRGEITLEGKAVELLENPIIQSTYLGYE
jgi:branched-chain amino acid transport system ATP-binding protein